jgi:uncharacterized protein YacL
MPMLIVRIAVIALLGGAAGYLFNYLSPDTPFAYLIGGALGIGIAVIFVTLEIWLSSRPRRHVIAGALGLLIGLGVATLLSLLLVVNLSPMVRSVITLGLAIVFSYLGVILLIRKLPEHWFNRVDVDQGVGGERKILDTSVIIDGRVADLTTVGFLEGDLVVPKFVLDELQLIADSSDALKRNRGRRGLDILNDMQKKLGERVTIDPTDFPELDEVDSKLVKLAMTTGGKVVTNDFNLNKVAELQGVDVLNINELANALKPVYIAGERMRVKLIKEGTEPGQAVGYLDDGTMVVVDRGRELINNEVEVVVTSVLQTSAGRMIFTKLERAH